MAFRPECHVCRYLSDATKKKYAKLTKVASHEFDLHHTNRQQVDYYHTHERGVDWLFVDHSVYQRPGTPYADEQGVPWADNVFRFHLLCLSALEAPLVLPITELRWAPLCTKPWLGLLRRNAHNTWLQACLTSE